MIQKLTESSINAAVDAHKVYSDIVDKISSRMDYIIHFCVEAVKGKVEWWEWGSGRGYEDYDFIHSYSPESLTINGEWKDSKMVFLDKNGNERDLECGGIPTRWLYEDFEEEYTKGLQLCSEKHKVSKTQALIASALAKLTSEEVKALRNI
jgi:hypothetical protein